MPLQYALTEYRSDKEKLLALLSGLNRAAEVSPMIAGFMESGEMFHPLRLTSGEAFSFLEDIEKRERVIVFTQFKEITEYLADYLTGIFHAKGHVIHGGTPVKRRAEIVDAFQGERYVPFIVLSVKAAGTGLNLTRANHVIHFDRWWNPAVENQATDRAFRIGQTKDVMVHKLVSQGTIEEKIDQMIHSKKELAENVIGSGSEKWITELSNEELFSLLRLESR